LWRPGWAIIRPVTGYAWYDLVGTAGVALIIGTYLMVQLGRADGAGLAASASNAIGASLILVSLYFDFNVSAFIVELFWVLISGIGIARGLALRLRGSG